MELSALVSGHALEGDDRVLGVVEVRHHPVVSLDEHQRLFSVARGEHPWRRLDEAGVQGYELVVVVDRDLERAHHRPQLGQGRAREAVGAELAGVGRGALGKVRRRLGRPRRQREIAVEERLQQRRAATASLVGVVGDEEPEVVVGKEGEQGVEPEGVAAVPEDPHSPRAHVHEAVR